ncbi:MAG TPA: hypothetical protein VFT53_05075 [Candidatus Saccharimonadales bacterium]|nr:hypothetical protein [Candidatus Saccharimonadales bacterium]
MGQHDLIILGLFAAPVLLLMLLRVNAALVFVSLCVGYVITQFLANDIQSFADLFVSHGASVSVSVMRLALLLFPAAFTTLFMIGTVRKARLLLNILPALAAGCLAALLVVPLLTPGTAQSIMSSSLWAQVVRLQSALVGGGALISMFFIWTQRPKKHHDEHSGKRH